MCDGFYTLAHELGQSLNELLGFDGPLTHRQYLGWNEWLREQWNRPDRADHYRMQIASSMSGEKIGNLKIRFGEPAQLTPEQIESVWLGKLRGHRSRKDDR